MVQVGQRVQVKQTGKFAPVWYGRTGLVTEDIGVNGFLVNIDPVEPDDSEDCGVQFYSDELIVLGGKHAGQPHPENFTNAPATRSEAVSQILGMDYNTGHKGEPSYFAELEAWEVESDLL